MKNSCCEQFQKVLSQASVALTLFLFLYSPFSLAAQDAIVIVDQAVVYSDQQMSSTVGFVTKGKRLRIGEVARNNSQVYPVIISGKIAYIRVLDVTTDLHEEAAVDYERYRKSTQKTYKEKIAFGFINYSSIISLSGKSNPGGLKDKDAVNWIGVGGKGDAFLRYNFDVQFLGNFLQATADKETFRMFEFGIGAGFRVIDFSRFKVSFEGQLLGVPFAQYKYMNDFRVNGFGFTGGGAGTASLRLGEHWGIEGSVGLYYTKLSGFKAPKQYSSIVPGFYGTRLFLGANYQY